MPACGQTIKPIADKRQKAAFAHALRTLIDNGLVHEVGIDEGPRHRRPALHKHAGDAPRGKRLERAVNGKKAVSVDRNRDDLGAAILEGIGLGMLFVGGATSQTAPSTVEQARWRRPRRRSSTTRSASADGAGRRQVKWGVGMMVLRHEIAPCA
jgi:hypothetical protein